MKARTAVGVGALLTTAALAAGGLEVFDPVELPFTSHQVALADLDGDGTLDLISTTNSTLEYRKGDGTGGFASHEIELANAGDLGESTFFVGRSRAVDIDGDDDLDVIAQFTLFRRSSVTTFGVFENNGDGTFTRTFMPSDYTNASSGLRHQAASYFVLLDANRDGRLDIVSAALVIGTPPEGEPYTEIAVYEQQLDGSFVYTESIDSPGPFVTSLFVADMNGDARPDIVVGSNVTDILLARAGGGFDAYQRADDETPAGPPVFVGDVNRDGHADVASYVTLHLGAGDGTFPSSSPIDAVFTQGHITHADIDGDLDLDLIATDRTDVNPPLRIALWENGSYVDCPPLATNSDASLLGPVTTGDLNGNGLRDIVVAESIGSTSGNPNGTIVIRQAGSPAPTDLEFVQGVITTEGTQEFELRGRNFDTNAQVDFGDDIQVDTTNVVDPTSVIARTVVPPQLGGGTRTVILTNPDGRRTQAQLEVHSVGFSVRSGKLRDRITPSDDVLKLRGRVRRNGLSKQEAFGGRTLGLELEIGTPTSPLVIAIPADDPRWTDRAKGRRLVFETAPTEFPRIRLAVDTKKETFVLRVTEFDYAQATEPVDLSYRAGDDLGRTRGTWNQRRKSRALQYRTE